MKLRNSELALETLVSNITTGEIDLQFRFRSSNRWTSGENQRLIDTILRGWCIPAIHLTVEPDGRQVVFDGLQRLTAIYGFMSGDILIDGSIHPRRRDIRELHGKSFLQISNSARAMVNRFKLGVVTLSDSEPQELDELYQRLNWSHRPAWPESHSADHNEPNGQAKDPVDPMFDEELLARRIVGFTHGRLAYGDGTIASD